MTKKGPGEDSSDAGRPERKPVEVGPLLDGLSKLAWPVLAAVLLFLLLDPVKGLVQDRGFTIRLGDAEFTVQEAADEQLEKTSELTGQILELSDRIAALEAADDSSEGEDPGGQVPAAAAGPAAAPAQEVPNRILWVDDKPKNNAYEVAELRARGIEVDLAKSTSEALSLLSDRQYAAAVTDMGRVEEGEFVPDAGVKVIEGVEKLGLDTRFILYSSSNLVPQYQAGLEGKGVRAADNSVELVREVQGKITCDCSERPWRPGCFEYCSN